MMKTGLQNKDMCQSSQILFLFFLIHISGALKPFYYQPVVINGSQLQELIGASIHSIVAYKFDGDWIQIPLQIDEKHWQDWATIKKEDCR